MSKVRRRILNDFAGPSSKQGIVANATKSAATPAGTRARRRLWLTPGVTANEGDADARPDFWQARCRECDRERHQAGLRARADVSRIDLWQSALSGLESTGHHAALRTRARRL